jgi:3-methyladenine DNA glycosylase AlkC
VSEKRKGAPRLSAVTPELRAQLEAGSLETATLSEGLAIRMDRLMHAAFPALPAGKIDPAAGVVARMMQAGAVLRAGLTADALESASRHASDTVRGWAAFAMGQDEARPSMHRLAAIRALAADSHFGVREWAWMAVRAIIVAEPEASIEILTLWTADPDPNVRRFACEATRPRGVWAASIPVLRKQPDLGLPILMPLRRDPERYVEDSVANWLNDSGKDRPDWLRTLLTQWQQEGVSARLLARAGRSLKVPALI